MAERNARNCCNGSVLKGKGVENAHTYSSCTSQIGMKLFNTIDSLRNYIIIGADATNAYTQSPLPTEPTFMLIDDQYTDWYFNKYGTQWDRKMIYQFSTPFEVTLNLAHFRNIMSLLFLQLPHMNVVYTVVFTKEEKFLADDRLTISRLLDTTRTPFKI
eukprot:772753-Ditylum_brightwellii.AAC.2